MNELKVIKQVLPVIDINFEEVKAGLEIELSKYAGIVVTDETLPDCVKMQKELSVVRRNLDGMRLDIQREVKKPLDEFNASMNELFNLVVSVEDPIKAGIKVFDDERTQDKVMEINLIMDGLIQKSGLREEFFNRIAFDKRWTNKTVTFAQVAEAIETQIEGLKTEQVMRDETIASIKMAVDTASAGLATPLDCDKYIDLVVDTGRTFSQVFGNIQADADNQRDAEIAAIEKREDEKKNLAPAVTESGVSGDAPKVRTVTVKITTTDLKLKYLSVYLAENDIAVEKIEG